MSSEEEKRRKDFVTISLKLSGTLLDAIDVLCHTHGYTSRADFIRDAIRRLILTYAKVER